MSEQRVTDVFRSTTGSLPLLISVPHDGREIPENIRKTMTAAGHSIRDTDWHVAELYEFASSLGANVLVARQSRYVVDLNRSADDTSLYAGQVATGLCPAETFDGESIYYSGDVSAAEKITRVTNYWQPYHDRLGRELAKLKESHGYALLWDAHSISSRVPRLFDGELPELNLGSNDGKSCASVIEQSVHRAMQDSCYSSVLNGRFKGGYITRHYGQPENNVHALQLEISQRVYMDESTLQFDAGKAARLRATLENMLHAFMAAARKENQ